MSIPGFAAPQSWNYFILGNPADVVTPTSGLLVLQGGGTDVDENFVRMGQRSGGGDFVVIRAFGTDAYNQYIFDLCNCDKGRRWRTPSTTSPRSRRRSAAPVPGWR
jgi:hypothetical protein